MIEIKLIISENDGSAGAAFQWNQDNISELELRYLKTMLPSLAREENEVHKIAKTILEENPLD